MSAVAALLVVAAVVLASSAIIVGGRRDHQRHPERADDDDAIAAFELIVGDLRSGASFGAAVATALHRHRQVLPWLRDALDRGEPLDLALTHAPPQRVTQPIRSDDDWFANGLALCGITGGNVADVLDRAVAAARERRAWRLERRAQAAQAQLSARLLTALPLGFAAWGALSSRSVRAAYLETPLTLICLVLGLALNGIGWWWMRRLVTIDQA